MSNYVNTKPVPKSLEISTLYMSPMIFSNTPLYKKRAPDIYFFLVIDTKYS